MIENMLTRRRVAMGMAVAAGAVGLMVAMPASAQEEPEVIVGDNPTCQEQGFDFGFRIESEGEVPADGEYTDEESGLVVTLSNVTEGEAETPATFDFETSFAISGVIVKSGNGALLYNYDPPVTSDTGLASPNPSISHLDFCWDDDTTTTSTTSTTSTTAPTTTTTAMDTTTTTAPTTATTKPAGPKAPVAPVAKPVTGQPTYTG